MNLKQTALGIAAYAMLLAASVQTISAQESTPTPTPLLGPDYKGMSPVSCVWTPEETNAPTYWECQYPDESRAGWVSPYDATLLLFSEPPEHGMRITFAGYWFFMAGRTPINPLPLM